MWTFLLGCKPARVSLHVTISKRVWLKNIPMLKWPQLREACRYLQGLLDSVTRDKNNQIELSFTAFYPAEEKRKQETTITPHEDTCQLYLLCVKHAWGVCNLKATTLFTTLYLWISVHWMNLFRLLSVQSIRLLLLLTTSDFYRFLCIFTGNTLASIQWVCYYSWEVKTQV